MANAALVHLYIPPHPSLPNRCENLDMAWIWPPGEKGGLDWGGGQFPSPIASMSSVFSLFTFSFHYTPLFSCLCLPYFSNLGQSIGGKHCTVPGLVYGTLENYFLQITNHALSVWNSM